MIEKRSLLTGAGAVIAGRAVVSRLVLLKLRRDVRRLNDGDYRPLLSGYAEDAVMRFNTGPHRWSGEHRGKPAIERFLQNFTAAGVQGELTEIWMSGPPWALTMAARFNDGATGADGEELYANRVAMVVRTRWGKIVEHDDFFLDTGRIVSFENKLRARGVEPAGDRGGGA
jgi:ketosteroid isomerase-like protein